MATARQRDKHQRKVKARMADSVVRGSPPTRDRRTRGHGDAEISVSGRNSLPRFSSRRAQPEAALDKRAIRDLHARDHSPTLHHQLNNLALVLLSIAAVLLWRSAWWTVTPLVWLIAGHFYHTKPLTFHDTAHGTWHPVGWKNELMGLVLGTLILVPLSVYRYAHALHHAQMSTERDPEMWPFVVPGTPRWVRILAACSEIMFGCIYVPMLFLRSVLVAGEPGGLNPPARTGMRLRIGLEYLGIVAFWSAVLFTVHRHGWWEPFLVGFAVPTAVAGMYQTLNKYTEHMGLLGNSVLSGTRTVVDRRLLGRVWSSAIQNVDHHGTHHRYARIPFYHLPTATPYVYASEKDVLPVFPSYLSAFVDMLKTLGDPRAGRQWRPLRDE